MVAKTRIHLAIIGCLTEDKISSNWLARQWVKTNNLQLLPAMIEFQLASRQMLKRSPDSGSAAFPQALLIFSVAQNSTARVHNYYVTGMG